MNTVITKLLCVLAGSCWHFQKVKWLLIKSVNSAKVILKQSTKYTKLKFVTKLDSRTDDYK